MRAGSQGQTQAALEGPVRDGLMKEGTARAVTLGWREYDTLRKLCVALLESSDDKADALRNQKYSHKECDPWQVFSHFWACFPIL